MKKYMWLIIVIILVLAFLFSFFYPQIRRLWLPTGAPTERPVK